MKNTLFPKDFTLKIFDQDMLVHVLGFSENDRPSEYIISIYPFVFITTVTATVNGNIGAFGAVDRVKVRLDSPTLKFEVEIEFRRIADMIQNGHFEKWLICNMYNDLEKEAIRRVNK